MIQGSFDIDTCKEIVGDGLCRSIESKARADADVLKYDVSDYKPINYWDSVMSEMKRRVYDAQYHKRVARNERKKANGQS